MTRRRSSRATSSSSDETRCSACTVASSSGEGDGECVEEPAELGQDLRPCRPRPGVRSFSLEDRKNDGGRHDDHPGTDHRPGAHAGGAGGGATVPSPRAGAGRRRLLLPRKPAPGGRCDRSRAGSGGARRRPGRGDRHRGRPHRPARLGVAGGPHPVDPPRLPPRGAAPARRPGHQGGRRPRRAAPGAGRRRPPGGRDPPRPGAAPREGGGGAVPRHPPGRRRPHVRRLRVALGPDPRDAGRARPGRRPAGRAAAGRRRLRGARRRVRQLPIALRAAGPPRGRHIHLENNVLFPAVVGPG